MTLEDALNYLKARGLVAKIVEHRTGPYIFGGTATGNNDGIEFFDEAFTIRPHVNEDGEEGFVAATAYPGQIGQRVEVADLKTAAEVIYTIYRQRELVPAFPTSGTWEVDAQALLDMGAKRVDADTVAGLLKELRQHRLALARIEGRIEGRLHMNQVAMNVHGDRLAREESRLRVQAYTNALADVQDVVKLMKAGEL